MPAPIDVDFQSKHLTNKEKNAKKNDKKAKTPSVKLRPPDIIRGRLDYLSRWKDVLKLYKGTELLNALDADMLARYVIEKYNLENLYLMREDPDVENNVELMLKVEARIEAKTKLLNQMALALYMTPRARAGAPVQQQENGAEDDPNAEMFS